jgi:hypothetical protein
MGQDSTANQGQTWDQMVPNQGQIWDQIVQLIKAKYGTI